MVTISTTEVIKRSVEEISRTIWNVGQGINQQIVQISTTLSNISNYLFLGLIAVFLIASILLLIFIALIFIASRIEEDTFIKLLIEYRRTKDEYLKQLIEEMTTPITVKIFRALFKRGSKKTRKVVTREESKIEKRIELGEKEEQQEKAETIHTRSRLELRAIARRSRLTSIFEKLRSILGKKEKKGVLVRSSKTRSRTSRSLKW